MHPDEAADRDDEFPDRLIAYEEALAAGAPPPPADTATPPDLAERLQRAVVERTNAAPTDLDLACRQVEALVRRGGRGVHPSYSQPAPFSSTMEATPWRPGPPTARAVEGTRRPMACPIHDPVMAVRSEPVAATKVSGGGFGVRRWIAALERRPKSGDALPHSQGQGALAGAACSRALAGAAGSGPDSLSRKLYEKVVGNG